MDREKAVAVAQDVIDQLESGEYYPIVGNYFRTILHLSTIDPRLKGDLRDIIPELKWYGCEVCALGAMMISKARLYDAVPARMVNCAMQHDVVLAISDVFDQRTIRLVETCYEQFRPFGAGESEQDVAAAINFVPWSTTKKERMIAIMQNIVDNNGEFKPGLTATKGD